MKCFTKISVGIEQKTDLKFTVKFFMLVRRKKGMAKGMSLWTSRLSPSGHYIFKNSL